MKKLIDKLKGIFHNAILLLSYRPWGRAVRPMIISIIDGKIHQGGLADRIKQILSIYAFCRVNSYKFGLISNFPYDLSNYLKPNYDWRVTEENFSRNIFWAHPIFTGNCALDKLKALLILKRRQNHVYALSSVSMFMLIKETGFDVGKLFDELFIPIPEISTFINKYRLQYKSWESLHFRFQNLLGDFNEPLKYQYKKVKLTDIEKEQHLMKCYQYVIDESFKITHYLLVCSDSISFLKKVSTIPKVLVIPGEITHTDFTSSGDFKLHLKSFLDFFMISESESVRSVHTSVMYPSGFPSLAAAIRGVKFERVLLE